MALIATLITTLVVIALKVTRKATLKITITFIVTPDLADLSFHPASKQLATSGANAAPHISRIQHRKVEQGLVYGFRH